MLSSMSEMVAELSHEMVVPLILNEPLEAPAPSVKLASAGVLPRSIPPSLAPLVMLVVPFAFNRNACRKLLVSEALPRTIALASVKVTWSLLIE